MAFRHIRTCLATLLVALLAISGGAPAAAATATQAAGSYAALPASQRAVFDDLERRTFQWFWDTTPAANGLTPDRWPGAAPSSIAAVGFALTAYGIGAERGYVTRAQAAQRTLATLRFFAHAPQGDGARGVSGYHGFFYHFLDMKTGLRQGGTELSSIDTTLLLGGVLFAQSYYDRDTPQEREIRALADTIYRRVDWTWMQPRPPLVSMGWTPERGFIDADWAGYSEANLLYILALGSPTHAPPAQAWAAWTRTNDKQWGRFHGYEFLNFAPLFGHQYSAAWIDFRGIRDAYMRRHGLDYFENARRAAHAQRAYAIANPGGWAGYGADVWGLTASDGPGGATMRVNGVLHGFKGYNARGAGLDYVDDDGTIAPTAAAGSIAFAPDIAVPAVLAMHRDYGRWIYGRYGFLDAFNLTLRDPLIPPDAGRVVPGFGWVDTDYIGIDQGPILLMLENWRSGFVWTVMKKNPYVRRGLQRAGFTGGWLERGQSPARGRWRRPVRPIIPAQAGGAFQRAKAGSSSRRATRAGVVATGPRPAPG
ncbi:glucoamylase family protein [Fulvimonas sp. R45]|uniref:glucoamylase family protein n=1 Tax=Fulvimonas sp. R45 TaxID=3045937 RepID=UPI00265E5DDB|nr:glucoamylase family protein [Fulvimonas sp. R45]MDO1529244.1 glucoamylase family protein [Fulvimonas sp. R45]